MAIVIIDKESVSLAERFALIQTRRKSRSRFPEGIVTIVASADAAQDGADKAKHLHPALVYGPSVSSESHRIYYLVKWLC